MTNQFGMGPMGMGSLSGMLESVELLKKAWSGFSLPASFAPTMDLDELDKRIADLKTVEQWLTMNLTLLRGTVQGMEIQRGTVAALKAFGASMGSDDLARGAFAAAAQAAASAAASATGSASAAAPETAPAGGAASSQPTGQPGPDAAGPSAAAAELTRAAAAAVNPATWWNLLQTQFAQVAQGAAAATPGEHAAAAASPGAAAPAAADARKAAARKPRRAAGARATAAPRTSKTAGPPAADAAPATGTRPRSRR